MRLETLLLGVAVLLIAFVGIRLIRPRVPTEGRPALGIDQVIQSLREGLERLDEERVKSGRAPLFRLQAVEVEVSFVVKRGTKSEAKAEFEVVTVGGSEDLSREEVQRLKVTLLPTPTRKGQEPPADPSTQKGEKQ